MEVILGGERLISAISGTVTSKARALLFGVTNVKTVMLENQSREEEVSDSGRALYQVRGKPGRRHTERKTRPGEVGGRREAA